MEDQCGFNASEYADLFPAIQYNLSMLMVSPDTAVQLFETMQLSEASSKCGDIAEIDEWQTNLPTAACIGGSNDTMAHMVTRNEMHWNDTIENVYGFLEGEVYPEEIVMVGAHRDAWGLGACDDISGTVTILEIARSLGYETTEFCDVFSNSYRTVCCIVNMGGVRSAASCLRAGTAKSGASTAAPTSTKLLATMA